MMITKHPIFIELKLANKKNKNTTQIIVNYGLKTIKFALEKKLIFFLIVY